MSLSLVDRLSEYETEVTPPIDNLVSASSSINGTRTVSTDQIRSKNEAQMLQHVEDRQRQRSTAHSGTMLNIDSAHVNSLQFDR